MANPLLTDENLKSFIESLKISQEQKNFLLEDLPNLDEVERVELLNTLKDIYILNENKDKTVKNVIKEMQG